MDFQKAATLVENSSASIVWLVKQNLITKAQALELLSDQVYSKPLADKMRISIQIA